MSMKDRGEKRSFFFFSFHLGGYLFLFID